MLARWQLHELGVNRNVIRNAVAHGRWELASAHVVRLAGVPRTDRQAVMAAVLDCGPTAVASHRCAAWLWGLPGFTAVPAEVSRARDAKLRSSLAVVHRPLYLPPDHCSEVDGIPVTTPARTLCDVAGGVRPQRLERAVDNALARKVVDLADLWLTFGDLAARGRPGRTAMGEILAARPPGFLAPESELEARFVALLDGAGICQPSRQVDVGLGDWVGRVDFLFRPERLVVEVDGQLAHSSVLDAAADARRDERLRAAGFVILRFTWADVVLRPWRTVAVLRRALAAAAA